MVCESMQQFSVLCRWAPPWLPPLVLPPSFGPFRRGLCITHYVLNRSDSIVGAAIYACRLTSILFSVGVSIFQSFPGYRQLGPDRSENVLFLLEAGCIGAFAMDYIARLLTCPAVPWTDEDAEVRPLSAPITRTVMSRVGLVAETSFQCLWRVVLRKLLHFLANPLNVIDAVEIFPFFIEFAPTLPSPPTEVFRVLRLLRIMRLLEGGGTSGVAVFASTFRAAAEVLGLLLFVVFLLMLFFASAVFYCEQAWGERGAGRGRHASSKLHHLCRGSGMLRLEPTSPSTRSGKLPRRPSSRSHTRFGGP